MKNLKKLFPLFAFVLGLGLVFTQSAFKSVKKDNSSTKQWFVYTAGTLVGQTEPSNYELYDDEGEPEDCTTGTMRCAIFAEPVVVGTDILPDLDNIDGGATKYQPAP